MSEPSANKCRSELPTIMIVMSLAALPWLATIAERGLYCDDFLFVSRAQQMTLVEALVNTVHMYGGLRPLGYAFMTVQYQLLGDWLLGHQLLLLSLHLIATMLLIWLFCLIFRRRYVAYSAGLLFAVMPWNLQTVVWPVCGLNLLAAIFLILSAVAYIGDRRAESRRWRMFVAVSCYAAALLCYEQYLAWFGVFPLLTWSCDSPQPSIKRVLSRSWPMMVTAVGVAILVTLTAAESERQASPVLEIAHIASGTIYRVKKVALEHIWLTLSGIRSYHWRVLSEWFMNRLWNAVILILILTGGVLLPRFWKSCVARDASAESGSTFRLAVAGLAMTMFPIMMMSLVPGRAMEQRAMYPLSIGLAFMIAVAISAPTSSSKSIQRTAILFCTSCLYTTFAICCSTRSQEWVRAWELERALMQQVRRTAVNIPTGGYLEITGFPNTFGAALTSGNHAGLNNIVRYATQRNDINVIRSPAGERLDDVVYLQFQAHSTNSD